MTHEQMFRNIFAALLATGKYGPKEHVDFYSGPIFSLKRLSEDTQILLEFQEKTIRELTQPNSKGYL